MQTSSSQTNRLYMRPTRHAYCENGLESRNAPQNSHVLRSRNQFSFALLSAISKMMSSEREHVGERLSGAPRIANVLYRPFPDGTPSRFYRFERRIA